MAAIWKDKADGKWRVQVRLSGNRRRSARFDTQREAKRWAAEIESDVQEAALRGGANSVGRAFKRYAEEVSPTRKGQKWETNRLHMLCRYPLADIPCGQVAAGDVAQWRDQRLKEVSAASVNRELNLMSSVFTRARKEWGWVRTNPVRDVDRPANPKHRRRRIDNEDEVNRILLALGYEEDLKVRTTQQHIAVAFLLAIETAMRLGELMGLLWSNVFYDKRYLHIVDSKNSDSRDVPLSSRAVELLKKIPQHGQSVFKCGSDQASTLFTRAVKRAGVRDLHFHDTRREALTRLSKKLDVLELAKMVGHRDPRSLMIYYAETAEEIAKKLD